MLLLDVPLEKEIRRKNLLILLIGFTLVTQALFYFDNISAEDVKLFLLKQMYKSLLFLRHFLSGQPWLAVPSKPRSQPIWLKVKTHGYLNRESNEFLSSNKFFSILN